MWWTMLIKCTDAIHILKSEIKEQLEKEGSPFHRRKLNTLTAGYVIMAIHLHACYSLNSSLQNLSVH